MSLRSSAVLSLVVAAATAAVAPSVAHAQAAGTATTAPKTDDAKKADGEPATAAPVTGPTSSGQTSAAVDASAMKTPADPTAAPPADEPHEDKRAVYISLDLGFSHANIAGFSDNTGFDKTSANGSLAGIGIGYRYREYRIGARFRDTTTTEYSLWSLMGEVAYGLPMRPVSPVFAVHAGYMFDSGVERAVIASSLPQGNALTPNVDLDGLVVGAEIFGSVWITKFLRVGPFIGLDFSFLHRSQVRLPQSILPLTDQTRNNALYNDSGSGVGYLLNLGIRGTGDIGF